MKDINLLIQNGVDINKSLELFGDINMYNESLGDFMAEIENKLYKISHFKDNQDMYNYSILVHSLKSDAMYFGFTILANLAYEHEMKSKENNIIYVNENYNSLMEEANKIVSLVKKYLFSEGQTTNDKSKEEVVTNMQETLLVADDSEIILNFVKKIFINEYNVLLAKDGAEAIEILKETPKIDVFLLDLNMPRVDGFKVMEFMKENNLFIKTPISVITGNDSREINLNAFEYPIVDILQKPFDETSLRTIVERTKNRY